MWRSRSWRRSAITPAAVGVLAVAASVAGCTAESGSPSRTSATRTPTIAAAKTAQLPGTKPPPAPCTPGALRVHGGRQGVEEGAHGDVELVNVSATACVLDGMPQLSMIRANGAALPVRQQAATGTLHARTLTAHDGSAWLALFWSNWCGARPGPLNIALRLPGARGTVQGPFNGPPDYDLVPACGAPGQPSIVQVVDAYS